MTSTGEFGLVRWRRSFSKHGLGSARARFSKLGVRRVGIAKVRTPPGSMVIAFNSLVAIRYQILSSPRQLLEVEVHAGRVVGHSEKASERIPSETGLVKSDSHQSTRKTI
jgi:hypothetical protein